MIFRSNGLLILSVFLFLIFSLTPPVESQTPSNKPANTPTISTKEWAVIDGFRSAKFGMSEKQVLLSIAQDFKVPKSKVSMVVSSTEKTKALTIPAPNLLHVGGFAKIVYLLGYNSKKLMQVNIYWMPALSNSLNGKEILSAAKLLRRHFVKKRYEKSGYIVNSLRRGSTKVEFLGHDKKNRGILLRILYAKAKDEKEASKKETLSLVLSYMLDPVNPDVFKATDKP
jgi:hypothetical protein